MQSLVERYQLLDRAARDRELGSLAVRLLLVISGYVNQTTGEAWPSQDRLARDLGITVRSVRTAIQTLVSGGWLTVEVGRGRGRASTYRLSEPAGEQAEKRKGASGYRAEKAEAGFRYSGSEKRKSHAEKEEADFPPTYREEPIDREEDTPSFPHTDFEEEVDRSEGIPDPVIPSEIIVAPLDRFEEFWTAYPRQIAKGSARNAFMAAVRRGVDPDAIIAGARRYAVERVGREDRFTPYPATWIAGERWEDPPANPVTICADPYRAEVLHPRSDPSRRPMTATEIAMAHVARRRAMEGAFQ